MLTKIQYSYNCDMYYLNHSNDSDIFISWILHNKLIHYFLSHPYLIKCFVCTENIELRQKYL